MAKINKYWGLVAVGALTAAAAGAVAAYFMKNSSCKCFYEDDSEDDFDEDFDDLDDFDEEVRECPETFADWDATAEEADEISDVNPEENSTDIQFEEEPEEISDPAEESPEEALDDIEEALEDDEE